MFWTRQHYHRIPIRKVIICQCGGKLCPVELYTHFRLTNVLSVILLLFSHIFCETWLIRTNARVMCLYVCNRWTRWTMWTSIISYISCRWSFHCKTIPFVHTFANFGNVMNECFSVLCVCDLCYAIDTNIYRIDRNKLRRAPDQMKTFARTRAGQNWIDGESPFCDPYISWQCRKTLLQHSCSFFLHSWNVTFLIWWPTNGK